MNAIEPAVVLHGKQTHTAVRPQTANRKKSGTMHFAEQTRQLHSVQQPFCVSIYVD